MMKKSPVYRTQRFMYFQILCYVLERWIRTQHRILFGKKSWVGSKIHHNTELWTQLTVSHWNSSGIFSKDSPHCSSSTKSKSSWPKWTNPNNSKDKLSSCRCVNDIIWGSEDSERECIANATIVSLFAKRFPPGRLSFIPRTWIRKEVIFYLHWQTWRKMGSSRWIDDDQVQRKRTPSFPSYESIVPRNAQKQRRWNISKTRLKLFFAQWMISVNQLSIYGVVSDLCDGYSACQARTARPVLAGQSDPLFEPARLLMTTPTPSTEVPAQEKLLQKYKERVERLSQQERLIKLFTDAGFLKTVGVGQYLMTKDTKGFSQFAEPVTCREYTLPRDEKSPDPKGWIRGNTKIGPVLEVTTSYLQGKYGVEIRIESVNKDTSHSWVRISHGLNNLVTDLIDKEFDDNEQETSETKTEEFALKTNVLAFCKPIKG